MQKFNKSFIIITVLCLAFGLSACTTKSAVEQTITGSYATGTRWNQIRYDFDETGKAIIRASSMSHEYFSKEGTYDINDDGDQITLAFSSTGISEANMASYFGTFSFSKEDDHLMIGGVRYEKEMATILFKPADKETILLAEISLKLPEEPYLIRYHVEESSLGITKTFEQTIQRTEDGIALNLVETGENYVFLRQDDNRYEMYRQNSQTEAYEAVIDTFTVNETIVNGYALRVSAYFDIYDAYRDILSFQGNEEINGLLCQKYSGALQPLTGKQTIAFWIEPESGMCIRGAYSYESSIGEPVTKTVTCIQVLTDAVLLPEVKK